MTKEDREFYEVQKGMAYEKEGNISKAISIYEKLLKNNFEGSYPYDRLCVIYRKNKDYENEVRVLYSAIAMFTKITNSGYRGDGPVKLQKYQTRLTKLQEKHVKPS